MCDSAYSASTVNRKVSTLIRKCGAEYHEHPDYWNNHLAMGHERLLTVDDLTALGITDPELLELAP